MPLELEIVLEYAAVSPQRVWEMLLATHPKISSQQVRLDDREINGQKVADAIQKSKSFGFLVNMPAGEIECGHVGSAQLELVFLHSCVRDTADASQWIEPFVAIPGFIMGRVYDYDFHLWQNADDPIQYSAAGKSITGLPMISNGLPSPLEQLVVDTSHNPGRRLFRDNYIEAVSSHMWLGAEFWRRVGVDPEKIESLSWLKTSRRDNDVLEIEAFGKPFTSSDGEEGRIQNELRSVLFPLHSAG